ncbi:hypothetical protein NEOKW01_1014 [Nematocida sp. AWRm80]|nr:hypothetical protein NEOKW01_1014 [Nematocida sp. AWRm80]
MERVKVFLRIKGERQEGEVSFTDTSAIDSSGMYEFDRIFYGENQEQIYSSVHPLLEMIQDGYSLSILAYGQTGSGKTYTMEGTEDNPGIIPRMLEEVYRKEPFTVAISAMEVYNEKVTDLLQPGEPLVVREDKCAVVVDMLTNKCCPEIQDALDLFRVARSNRRTETNGINAQSSRSHMIFRIEINAITNGCMVTSKITLVDLAGSEKMDGGTTQENQEIKRPRVERNLETSKINKSLLCLSRIISTLSSGTKPKHINYRDSKLTFILRDTLSGHTNLAIIGAVNPANQMETKSTIKFLSTAKEIKLSLQSTADEQTVQKLVAQIRHLNTENLKLTHQIQIASRPITRAADQRFDLEQLDSLATELELLNERIAVIEEDAQYTKKEFDKFLALDELVQQRAFANVASAAFNPKFSNLDGLDYLSLEKIQEDIDPMCHYK